MVLPRWIDMTIVTARLNDCDKEGDDTSGLLLFRIFINKINYNQHTTCVQEQKQKGCCSQESGRANLVPPGVQESEMNVARPFKGHSTPGRGVHWFRWRHLHLQLRGKENRDP